MQFYPVKPLSADFMAQVRQTVRRRLLRYCAGVPFAGRRIRIEAEHIVYRCPKAPAGEQVDTSKPPPTQAYQSRNSGASPLYQTIQTHFEPWLE